MTIDSISSQLKRWCQTLINQLLVELVSKCMEYKFYLMITLFILIFVQRRSTQTLENFKLLKKTSYLNVLRSHVKTL